MRAFVMIAMLTIAVPDRPAPGSRDSRPLQERIQGEWRMVEYIVGGKSQPFERVFVFNGKLFFIHQEKGKTYEYTFTIDAGKQPASLDIIPKSGVKALAAAICRIDGDMLTICFNRDGGITRPTDFASPMNTKMVLWHLQRIRK